MVSDSGCRVQFARLDCAKEGVGGDWKVGESSTNGGRRITILLVMTKRAEL